MTRRDPAPTGARSAPPVSPPPPADPGPDDSPAWTEARLADPHGAADKARRVRRMFAAIAPSYDLNNRLHSLGRDQAWRRAAVELAGAGAGEVVCDVACGTGDLAMAFTSTPAAAVFGLDFTAEMLQVAERKKRRATGTGAAAGVAAVRYAAADALALPLGDRSVDVVSIAFGLRNVADPAGALAEFFRVLRPGGRVIVLEFTVPSHPLMRLGYRVYCEHIMPRTASWIARDRGGAYRYLPRSVRTFFDRQAMTQQIQRAGFTRVTSRGLTFGIAAAYRGHKPG